MNRSAPLNMPRSLLILVMLVLAACTASTKVGNSNLLNIKQQTGDGFEATTTQPISGTLPPGQAPPTAPPTTRPAPVTTLPRHTTTTISPAEQKAITAVIKIEGASSSAFVPSVQTVYPGTPVKWINDDVVARSVVSDDGSSFDSGSIPPGGSYTWTASGAPRQISYHDGTRPYAVAQLQLVTPP